MHGVSRLSLPAALLGGLVLGMGARAKACDPAPTPHLALLTIPLQNQTGMTANELQVDLTQSAFVPPTPLAPPMTYQATGPLGTNTLHFKGGSVAANSTVPVTWESFSDSRVTGGAWSRDGSFLGDFGPQPISVDTSISSSSLTVGLDNTTGKPLPYSNLFGFRGVDGHFFTPADYLFGLEELGSPVTLLVDSSGILAPGVTEIAMVSNSVGSGAENALGPLVSPYDGGIITIDGLQYSMGVSERAAVSAVPEPSTLLLLVAALLLIGAALAVRQLRKCCPRSAHFGTERPPMLFLVLLRHYWRRRTVSCS